jgi:hypothetical protein
VARSVAELAALCMPRGAGPADVAGAAAALCADLAPHAWPLSVDVMGELVAVADAALARDAARSPTLSPLKAALAALRHDQAAQPDWLAADALARRLCAAFQEAERLGAPRGTELRTAASLRQFAEVASAADELGGALAAADSASRLSSLPFALLMKRLTGSACWQELEFDGMGVATFRDGVLTLRLYESKSSPAEGACPARAGAAARTRPRPP